MSGGNPAGWLGAPYAGAPWLTNRDAVNAVNIMRSSYGAIAYSASTRRYGWSFGADGQVAAERTALRHCGAADATILVWGQNTWLALAIADNGAYGWAYDGNRKRASDRALAECGGTNRRIAALFHSLRG